MASPESTHWNAWFGHWLFVPKFSVYARLVSGLPVETTSSRGDALAARTARQLRPRTVTATQPYDQPETVGTVA
jgi:hypothetical protein